MNDMSSEKKPEVVGAVLDATHERSSDPVVESGPELAPNQAMVPTDEAIERVVSLVRSRLQSAMQNGQRVRVHMRDGGSTRVSTQFARRATFSDLFAAAFDGSFEMQLSIEPRKRT